MDIRLVPVIQLIINSVSTIDPPLAIIIICINHGRKLLNLTKVYTKKIKYSGQTIISYFN